MDLHYSVNGQAEKVVPLLNAKGSPTGEGKVVLYLEDFKLVPGDIVSMYATANDARSKTVGDITFIEAQPYERNFSQSQQGGGGGGGGGGQQNDPSQITQREKEIIAATHNFNRGGKDAQANAENAQYLSEVQSQAEGSGRVDGQAHHGPRALDGKSGFPELHQGNGSGRGRNDSGGRQAEKPEVVGCPGTREQGAAAPLARHGDVPRHSGGPRPARRRWRGRRRRDAGRDLANLFDLELDTEKNQYESQQSSSGDKQQQAIDDAMQKLEQLARRQQQLAQQSQNKQAGQRRPPLGAGAAAPRGGRTEEAASAGPAAAATERQQGS